MLDDTKVWRKRAAHLMVAGKQTTKEESEKESITTVLKVTSS